MNDLQIFNNPEFGEIRAVEIDGKPWFVGKDVEAGLGYSDTFGALKSTSTRRISKTATTTVLTLFDLLREAGTDIAELETRNQQTALPAGAVSFVRWAVALMAGRK